MKNKPAICITTRRHIAKSGYTALMIMINNNVPSSPAESAFIMETMKDVAIMIDDSDKGMTELDLTYDKAVAVWHSCNVTLNNELAHNQTDGGFMMELMDLLANKLDGEVNEDDTEDKTECSTEQGRDGGVPNGKQGLSIVGSEDSKEL